jgi:hypothetical protein
MGGHHYYAGQSQKGRQRSRTLPTAYLAVATFINPAETGGGAQPAGPHFGRSHLFTFCYPSSTGYGCRQRCARQGNQGPAGARRACSKRDQRGHAGVSEPQLRRPSGGPSSKNDPSGRPADSCPEKRCPVSLLSASCSTHTNAREGRQADQPRRHDPIFPVHKAKQCRQRSPGDEPRECRHCWVRRSPPSHPPPDQGAGNHARAASHDERPQPASLPRRRCNRTFRPCRSPVGSSLNPRRASGFRVGDSLAHERTAWQAPPRCPGGATFADAHYNLAPIQAHASLNLLPARVRPKVQQLSAARARRPAKTPRPLLEHTAPSSAKG